MANTNRKSCGRRFQVGSAKKNVIGKECQGFLHVLSSSPTEDIESVSSEEIIGPELPPIQGSSKRLFLVRHGEVINPGEKKNDQN